MKYLIATLLVLVASSSRAQITLEHTYPSPPGISLIQVEDSEWKYISTSTDGSTLLIYNLDHSLEKTIVTPTLAPSLHQVYGSVPQFITKKLFSLDGLYDYLIELDQLSLVTLHQGDTSSPWVVSSSSACIYNENGVQLFSSDSDGEGASMIFNTERGTKLLLPQQQWTYYPGDQYNNPNYYPSSSGTHVYSLPGKLPGSIAHSDVNPPTSAIGISLPTSAYPNPSNGQVRIEYTLPDGVQTGKLIITDLQGNEVKRYRVGTAFNDILISKSDLASGSYFYKIITEKGESNAKRLVVLK